MYYDQLVKEIKRRPRTQIGGILAVAVKECIRSKIFKDNDALLRFITRVIDEEDNG